ncbi:MAG: aldo/keto reductase [Actinomycetaceae bacterium]|nr:aldo/keto reductase [Arcanobacterium sp.]MDD7504458.1 aldo/keto reductase [Actinomycetaceae bacterium]MDY6143984.1 aldo/keto reductase [Arcanobacterium sp.]
MKYNNIGASGLRAGFLGLGTLTWGMDTDLDDARRSLVALREAGGNFVDVSPLYSDGGAVSVLSELLKSSVGRNELIISAHLTPPFDPRASDAWQGAFMGRAAILTSLDSLLAALGTDTIDFAVIDYTYEHAPVDETMAALADAVHQGKIRYVCINGAPLWFTAMMAQHAISRSYPPITGLAQPYSLLERGNDSELLAAREHFGIGMIAYSPLAGGVLTGKYNNTIPPTSRAATEHLANLVSPYLYEAPLQITGAVARAADGLARTPADVALAWLMGEPNVSVAVCGPRTGSQAEQLFSAQLDALPTQVAQALDDISRPQLKYPEE